MKRLSDKLNKQIKDFEKNLSTKISIKIGTLGPNGTSSEQAVEYLVNILKKINPKCKYEIVLQDDFQFVLESLENLKIDYALVPSAYDRITDFFWSFNLVNALNFIYETPDYGIICKNDYDFSSKLHIRVAACSAVRNVVQYLGKEILKDKDLEMIDVRSTAEAVLYVLDNKADMGITNETSFQLHKDKGIKFVSNKYNAHIVWTLFANKMNLGQVK